MTAGGGSFGCVFWVFFLFLISQPSKQISVFQCAPQHDNKTGPGCRGVAGSGFLGSLARICKLLLSSCILLFFALYTPGSPPISGAHWSVKQSKLQSSSSLTASSRPQQAGQRLLPKFPKSKRPPLKTHLFQILDRWTPTEVWRSLVLQEPEGAAVIISDLFMIFVSVLGMRRGNADLFCT